MSNELAISNGRGEVIEAVIAKGDLAKLSDMERVNYYRAVCESVGLNPMTRPFEYIILNGKTTLYARKDATDQLRAIKGISLHIDDIAFEDDLVIVTVSATDKEGRSDSDVGAVAIGTLKGEARANAIMKAITKAKRRVTLSCGGLGWLDETELEYIPSAIPIRVEATSRVVNGQTGEITETPQPADIDLGMGDEGDDAKASRTLLGTMHGIGRQLYGDAWDDKRHELARKLSKGRTASSEELTNGEVMRMIEGMGDKMRTNGTK